MRLQKLLRQSLLIVLAVLSCGAQADSKQAPTFKALSSGAKVVLMPMDVELFVVSAGGVLEPQAEWTTKALENLKIAFRERQQTGKVVFSEFPSEPDEAIESLNRLHGAVGTSINIHHFGALKLPTKEGRLEWTLGPDVATVREKTGADYALFTFVRDSYASSERAAAMVVAALFGVGLPGGVQIGYASLVDLSTGEILWFNRLVRGSGDLREAEKAKESLSALLDSFPG
jgi:hypothetical protein